MSRRSEPVPAISTAPHVHAWTRAPQKHRSDKGLAGGGFYFFRDWVLRGLVLVKFERDVRLALAAAEHFLIEMVVRGGVAVRQPDELGSAPYGRIRFGFTFAVVFPI
jgi:hypothetical protein